MSRRERKKEETRVAIIDSAAMFFKNKGFHETSMEEIAEKADVSKGTLYNYFSDKEAILVGYFQLIIGEYGRELKLHANNGRSFKEMLSELLDFINGAVGMDLELTAIYYRYRMQRLFDNNPFENNQRSGFENATLEIIAEAQKNGEIRNDFPALTLARNLQMLIMSFLVSNIYSKEPFDMNKLKLQIADLFLNGVKR